jgi:fructose transport system ATP-binding protein
MHRSPRDGTLLPLGEAGKKRAEIRPVAPAVSSRLRQCHPSTELLCLSGLAVHLAFAPVHFRSPLDARRLGIETVYQDLAVAPALDIATNLFLGREVCRSGPIGSWFRLLDKGRMRREAQREMDELKFHLPSIDSAVEKLSGGQRQGVAVARAAIFARRLVIMDEPTAALGVRESGQVLNLIRTIRDRGLPVILISHDMPHVFEVADRIQIMRLGRRAALTTPQRHTMSEVVAIMTGAARGDESTPDANQTVG